jgi:ATP-binding cassette subfamily C protein CydD
MPETDQTPAPARGRPVDPRLLRYATASRGFFAVIAVIGLAQTAVIVAFAWLLTRAITEAIELRLSPEVLGALALVIAVRALLLWARDSVSARAASRVQMQLRANLMTAVGALGPEWLDRQNSARLAVTAGRGLESLEAYFSRYLPQLVQTTIATPIIVAVMWWQDWISGLTVVLTLPLIPLFMVLIGLATRSVQQKQWQTLGRLAARFADTVRGLSTLKVFGRHHRAVASIRTVTDTYRRETLRVLRVSFLSGFALELLASIAVAIVAVSIGFRLMDGSLALVVGLFVLLLAPEAYLPLRQVGVQFHAAAEGVAATDDVFAVLDAADGIRRSPVQAACAADDDSSRDDRTLELCGVRVVRADRELPPVSFAAARGSVTLIEGPSGAGKSSVFAALRGAAGFRGTATFGGVSVDGLDPSSWLAWAGQQPGLVTGTVADNVSLGDRAPADQASRSHDDATRAELVRRALHLAGADGIAPDRPLGVQGAGLSGGQAQRVAVARAIYHHLRHRVPVIALDEPSAALDPVTEALLWTSLRALADDGAIVLVISHRTSARAIADQVVDVSTEVVDA